MARLERYWDGHRVATIELKKRDYLIGRDPDADLVLQDPFASRKHFQLSWSKEGYYILTDLKTRNGTVVNGVKEFQCKLRTNTTVQVGHELILFIPSDDPPEDDDDLLPAWVLNSVFEGDDPDLADTALMAPAVLARMQARMRLRQKPHLIRRLPEGMQIFPLDTSVTTIGLGASVRVSLGSQEGGSDKVLCEIIRDGSNRFRIRAKGFFGRVSINGVSRKEHVLEDDDRIELPEGELEFHLGLKRD